MSTHGNARPGKYGTPAGLFTSDARGIARWDQARYQWRRAHGLCVTCGREADRGCKCAACREHDSARIVRRRDRLRAAGLCRACGLEPTATWYCEACKAIVRVKDRAARAARKEARS